MNQTYETTVPAQEHAEETPRKTGVASGVLIGTLMIGFGLLAAFAPVATGLSLAYVVTAGLGVYGATQLVSFVRAGKERRSGWALANGIVQGNGGALMPNNTCTRGQIVTFLYRASK